MEYITTTLSNLLQQTAFLNLTVGNMVMIFVALIFLYLAIQKGFEPLCFRLRLVCCSLISILIL